MVCVNQLIGEYVLEERIGRGTFGEVWRARHQAWADRLVAVKIPTDPRYIASLQREGMATDGLAHPNIVRPINFGPFADPPYFVTEYVPGANLRVLLLKHKSLHPRAALSIFMPVLRGLAHAHGLGLVHRDVKPENVLIRDDAVGAEGVVFDPWGVKLTDFGLGRTVRPPDRSIAFSEDLRSQQHLGGTPRYMSPEQAAGDEVDGRADLYSCGVILFEMLTGQLPVGTDVPSDLNPDVPQFLDDAFRRSYARVDKRFDSAQQFLSFLESGGQKDAAGPAGEQPQVAPVADLAVRVWDNRIIIGEHLQVSFQRTLRIPDDGNTYPLPPGLGRIPVHRVQDYADRVPPEWNEHGGVFIPLYQREALWILFEGEEERPHAVKVAVGMVNAVTGDPWDQELHGDPQDYLVCPHQPWLDGINCGNGHIRQFVAMPLGQGYTVEGQVTGKEEFGGIQIIAFPLKLGSRVKSPHRPINRQDREGEL